MNYLTFFKILVPVVLLFCMTGEVDAQEKIRTLHADAIISAAKYQGNFSLGIINDWHFGNKRRITVGLGLRFNTYFARNQYYITAPAKLTSGETGPQVLFIENITANIDTFLVKTAQVNSFNVLINLGYHVSEKWFVGFNIDAIGFSFGRSIQGNYINGFSGARENAAPTPFNLLLISDNDKGSLNSELYTRYQFRERLGIKAGLQFLFTEYTTDSKVQQLPEPNDRFRRKSLLIGAGITYKLK